VERVPLETKPTPENLRYLQAKREKLGHLLENLEEAPAEAVVVDPDTALTATDGGLS
jgi:3,4-dihydroxy 2-butanone 4-phosphate synthase/GTP cyclohydrolase II